MNETQGCLLKHRAYRTASASSSDINNEAVRPIPRHDIPVIPVQLFPDPLAKAQFLANIFIFCQSFITPATRSKKRLTCQFFLFDAMHGNVRLRQIR